MIASSCFHRLHCHMCFPTTYEAVMLHASLVGCGISYQSTAVATIANSMKFRNSERLTIHFLIAGSLEQLNVRKQNHLNHSYGKLPATTP